LPDPDTSLSLHHSLHDLPHHGIVDRRRQVRGGEEHLVAGKGGDEALLMQIVELREDVIEEDYRPLVALELQVRALQEEQGKNGGTLLPPRGEALDGAPSRTELPIVAVGACGRGLDEDVFQPYFDEVTPQIWAVTDTKTKASL